MSLRCRRRGHRMTTIHKTVFVNWLKLHPDNIRVLKGGPSIGKQWKNEKWKEITATLNGANSYTPPKSIDKWRKSIGDLMGKLKKKHRFGERLVGLESLIMKLYEAPLPECRGEFEDMSSNEENMVASSDDYCSETNKDTKNHDILYLTEPEVTDKLESYLTEAAQEPEPEPIATKKELNNEILVNNANRQTAAMESIAKSLLALTKQSEQTNEIMVKCVETLSSLVEVLTNKNKS